MSWAGIGVAPILGYSHVKEAFYRGLPNNQLIFFVNSWLSWKFTSPEKFSQANLTTLGSKFYVPLFWSNPLMGQAAPSICQRQSHSFLSNSSGDKARVISGDLPIVSPTGPPSTFTDTHTPAPDEILVLHLPCFMKTAPAGSLVSSERSAQHPQRFACSPATLPRASSQWQLIFRRAIISYNIPLLRQHRPEIKRSNPLPTFLLLRGMYSSIPQADPSLSCRPGTHLDAGYHGDKASFLSFSSWSFQSSRERITCPVLFHLESTLEAPGYFWKASKSRLQSNEIRISGCGSLALWWFYNVEPRLRSI